MSPMIDSNPAGPDLRLEIVVEAAPKYLIGFPVVIFVTYGNPADDAEFYALPDADVWGNNSLFGVRLSPIRGGALVDVPARSSSDTAGPTTDLGHRETRRMTLDLTNYGLDIKPGVYELTLLARPVGEYASAPVIIEFIEPPAADAKEAARLRRLGLAPGAADYGNWSYFLVSYGGALRISPSLSSAARQQLGLHIFLHHAFQGPDDVAHLVPSALDALTEPSMQAEIAALKLEIAIARLDPAAAKMRMDLLRRWPGMRHRVDDIDRGRGVLTAGRQAFHGGGREPPSSAHITAF